MLLHDLENLFLHLKIGIRYKVLNNSDIKLNPQENDDNQVQEHNKAVTIVALLHKHTGLQSRIHKYAKRVGSQRVAIADMLYIVEVRKWVRQPLSPVPTTDRHYDYR